MENVQKWVVAVVGSRGVTTCPALLARLDALLAAGALGQVVSGGAAGVDRMAARWAGGAGVGLLELLPDYRAHGQAAPLVRNAAIVAAADVVLVVWDGQSRGTLDAARKAARTGKRVEWLGAPAPGTVPVPGGLGL
ncbi:SLOG family protein [Hymenobacter artigasi]|uniref:Rossmann fold nucleotide-binding protein DprA/Smf involved in DNA uptake n=1 Tax=Hymenobacter artigasi TaxID=2719616 RepID=A0ABX1HMU0_9BACT|nr:SLOG family protein [Hymenobacter artigasi]NKI90173.1 putative Rossmann fold nucleotide-binding protein DprA/Smf involved in DNA uptake [Hymenobacter artigasi]